MNQWVIENYCTKQPKIFWIVTIDRNNVVSIAMKNWAQSRYDVNIVKLGEHSKLAYKWHRRIALPEFCLWIQKRKKKSQTQVDGLGVKICNCDARTHTRTHTQHILIYKQQQKGIFYPNIDLLMLSCNSCVKNEASNSVIPSDLQCKPT